MVSKLRKWLAKAIPNVQLIGREPVFAVGLAIEGLHAYEKATSGGLKPEDAAYAAVVAILTLLGRQLVYPAVKVDAATSALKEVEPVLEKPYVGPDGN